MPIKHKQSAEVKAKRQKSCLNGFEKTLTQQSEKDKCCVNNIMAKYRQTGLITHFANGAPMQGNFVDVGDFQDAMNVLAQASESFNSMPAELRKRFDNDPAEFLAFVKDPKNFDEMVRLGLAEAKPSEPAPSPVTPHKVEGEGGDKDA